MQEISEAVCSFHNWAAFNQMNQVKSFQASNPSFDKRADMPNKSHKITKSITKANLLAVQELFIISHSHHGVLLHVKLQMVRLIFCFLFFLSTLGNFS